MVMQYEQEFLSRFGCRERVIPTLCVWSVLLYDMRYDKRSM